MVVSLVQFSKLSYTESPLLGKLELNVKKKIINIYLLPGVGIRLTWQKK